MGWFVASLYTCTAVLHHVPPSYRGKFVDGHSNVVLVESDAESVDLDVEDIGILDWQLWSFDYVLDTGDNLPVLPSCTRDAVVLRSSVRASSHPKQRKHTPTTSSSRRLVVDSNEQLLHLLTTYTVVVATLQLFLHLTSADATAPLLPLLSRAAGVLGPALATRRYGRAATCAVSAALTVLCQAFLPAMVAAHAGLGLGGASSGTRTTTTFVVARAVSSCALGWAWGALFWASPGPGEGVRSLLTLVGFAQMHCSLLVLRRLRHAALAYCAARIWS